MTRRTRSEIVTFLRPFILTGLGGMQPAGRYTVETDEELLPTMSSTAYRRLVTWFRLPAIQPDGWTAPGRTQAAAVDPIELEAALDRDAMLGSRLPARSDERVPRDLTEAGMSYFRRKAEQCYHHAELVTGPQSDGETVRRLGDEFTAKADAAAARLTNRRDTITRRVESERQSAYWDRRE